VPVAFDQPDNAARAVKLGVARALPFQKVTAMRLTGALQSLLNDPAYAARAADVATRVAREDSLATVCGRLEALLQLHPAEINATAERHDACDAEPLCHAGKTRDAGVDPPHSD
jgi:hypothetical protein